MTIRYEYKSECCQHEYVEQRGKDEPMFFPKCNKCETGDYVLVQEVKLSDEVELSEDTLVPTDEEVIEDAEVVEVPAE